MKTIIPLKWRPQTFDEVVGQDHIVKALKRALEKGEIVHGYLFSGTRGVGKTSVARILAKALNCVKGPTPNFCGECENCREISQGISRDVIEIDAASHTGVDNIREIIEKARFSPFKSRFKIYIIDEVHMLSQSAFNALLKTLEEPPEHVIFILATTEPRKIPETVLSRLQKYFFRRIPDSLIEAHLKRICSEEGINLSEKVISALSKEAEGSMRDAEALLEQAKTVTDLSDDEILETVGVMDHRAIEEMASYTLEGKEGKLIRAFETLYSKGFEPEGIIKRLIEHLTDRYISEEGNDIKLEQAIRDLLEAERCLSFSRTKRSVTEYFLIKAARRRRLKSLQEILSEIQSIRRSIEAGLPVSSEEGDSEEKRIVSAIEDEFPHISRSSSVEINVSGNKVVFTIKGKQFLKNLIEKSTQDIKKAVEKKVGISPEIVILFEEEEETAPQSIKEHPLVKEFLEAFDGKIIDIKEER